MATAVFTPGLEEGALIREILGGRRELFADLIAPHVASLLQIVRRTIGIRAEVDDVVQQASLKALVHLGQFRFQASFRTWLIRIGLNEARQWLRKRACSRMVALDPPVLAQLPAFDEGQSPLTNLQKNEVVVLVRNALAELPEIYRIVILMRDFEEVSAFEVARRLGLTTAAVKTRHFRARLKMAEFLGPLTNRNRSFAPADDCPS
jgi:RNA polymerase sigma-70 factor (ECF subfamily)